MGEFLVFAVLFYFVYRALKNQARKSVREDVREEMIQAMRNHKIDELLAKIDRVSDEIDDSEAAVSHLRAVRSKDEDAAS